MNKIMITIYVISIGERFDILIPIGLKVSEVLDMIQESLCDLTGGIYLKRDSVDLYTADGLLINKNNIVKFSGLKNGMTVAIY